MDIAVIIIVIITIIVVVVVVVVVIIAVIIVIIITTVANLVIFFYVTECNAQVTTSRAEIDPTRQLICLPSFFPFFSFLPPTPPLSSCFRASNTSRSTSLCEYPVCVYPGCDFVSVNRQAVALKVV
jgi:hypothetical protein